MSKTPEELEQELIDSLETLKESKTDFNRFKQTAVIRNQAFMLEKLLQEKLESDEL